MKSKWRIECFLDRKSSVQEHKDPIISPVCHTNKNILSKNKPLFSSNSIAAQRDEVVHGGFLTKRTVEKKDSTSKIKNASEKNRTIQKPVQKPKVEKPYDSRDIISYRRQIEDKNKKIETLMKQNRILKLENKQLMQEKAETAKLLKEFAHTMGKIIQSLFNQTKAPATLQPSHRVSASSTATDLGQAEKAMRDVRGTHMRHISIEPSHQFLRKSVTSILQERSQTTAMVQSALDEIQLLMN
jgi:hypothetical protein